MYSENIGQSERALLVFLRLAIGWVFLWAGIRQVFLTPDFTVASFLANTKTFHDFFALFMLPATVGITSFLVKWGHFLIGLSLISGLLVRVSGVFALLMLGLYYLAHMDFPYVEGENNLLIDFHLVYMAVLGYLMLKRAGHVWGLDGLVEKSGFGLRHPQGAPLLG